MEAMAAAASLDKMWNYVLDQQDRLLNLEREHARLLRVLTDAGISAGQTIPTLVEETPGQPQTAVTYRFDDSPSGYNSRNGLRSADIRSHSSDLLTPKPPLLQRNLSSPAMRGQNRLPLTGAPHSGPLPSSPTPPVDPPPPTPAPTASNRDRRVNDAKHEAHSAAKSFRVTMEDPCYKVLPAALKKYKINDDWKMYALFICFGNTERCLSYDEKPLLLFQKLKEGGQRPVFMLRHIRDIKSPIAVAQQKQAVKLGLPPNSDKNLLPTIESTLASPTKATSNGTPPTSGDRPAGRTPGEGTFPELPSPGMRDAMDAPKTPGTLVDKNGQVHKVTYAISIYPYIADRQDEFDVAVGATFVVMSKAKGWWFVQKDPSGTGNIIPEQEKSAWVPAGCLLELTAPVATVSPSSPGKRPGRAPIPPANIMSSSYAGLVLMDYVGKDDNELTLKAEERIRVYKKYCHWSYSIKEETGERGWVPAWFVGKLPNDAQSQATVVAAQAAAQQASSSTTAAPGTTSSVPTPGLSPQAAASAGGAPTTTVSPGLTTGDSSSPGHDE